jgi:hypothetical protein
VELNQDIRALSNQGLNGKEIARELDASYWIVRRVLAEIGGEIAQLNEDLVDDLSAGDDSPYKEVDVPMSIKMINWELFMPYAVSLLQNPHTGPEDRSRVTKMLHEVSSFLKTLTH